MSAPSSRGRRAHRRFADVTVGEQLPGADYPLPVCRLVMAAGATRDFAAIHHNDNYARARGAEAMYANAIFLQGMWERVLRDYIGPGGHILAIRNFRMVRFTMAGSLARVEGTVVGKHRREEQNIIAIELRTLVGDTVTVGPGLAEVTLP